MIIRLSSVRDGAIDFASPASLPNQFPNSSAEILVGLADGPEQTLPPMLFGTVSLLPNSGIRGRRGEDEEEEEEPTAKRRRTEEEEEKE